MRRGVLESIAMQNDFGKRRPAVDMHADWFNEPINIAVLPMTDTLVASLLLRNALKRGLGSSRQMPSQATVDEVTTVERGNGGPVIDRIGTEIAVGIERRLAAFGGMAKLRGL